MEKIWMARKNMLFSIIKYYPNTHNVITDVCVPMSNLPKAISDTKEEIKKLGLNAPILGNKFIFTINLLINRACRWW